MDLDLRTFNRDDLTLDERKDITLGNKLDFRIKESEELVKVLEIIFKNYDLGNDAVFYLKDEHCEHCRHELKRKDIIQKTLYLPGGNYLILYFCRYSCEGCKKPVDRKLEPIFKKHKHYSGNVQSDSVRMYMEHLSSYERATDEINGVYGINMSKRTVRLWTNEAGEQSDKFLDDITRISDLIDIDFLIATHSPSIIHTRTDLMTELS